MHTDDRITLTPLDNATSQSQLLELARQWHHAEAVLAHAVEVERRAIEAKHEAQQRLAQAVESLGEASYADIGLDNGVPQECSIPTPRCAVNVSWLGGYVGHPHFAVKSIPYAAPDAG